MKKLGELGHLKRGEIYFFNPINKDLSKFKAKFVGYDEISEFIVVEDLKHHKQKSFHKSFVENIEDLRE